MTPHPPRKVIMDILFENDAAIFFILEEGTSLKRADLEHKASRKWGYIFRVIAKSGNWQWKDAIREISKQTGH
jgi:hypothetical protein